MPPRPERAPRALRRNIGGRRPRKTLLVFCEGERTEPEYLNGLSRLPQVRDVAAVDIRIDRGSAGFAPIRLVRLAVEARERNRREQGEIDEFWCVFDVEWPKNHSSLGEAIRLADRNGIQLAISNPCFELWLVLHFADCGSWLDNRLAQRRRREHDGTSDKGLDPARYMPLRHDAATRARRLERRHAKNGIRSPDDNPSSGMHRLIDSVEAGDAPNTKTRAES
jgi:hypothetical protein